MKKLCKLLVLVLVVAVTAAVPAACSLGSLFGNNGNQSISNTRHTVTFDSCGGSNISSKRVVDGGSIREPKPTRKGYDLVGWYLDAEYQNKFDFDEPIYDDMTLYAKWGSSKQNEEKPSTGDNKPVTALNDFQVTYHYGVVNPENGKTGITETVREGHCADKLRCVIVGYQFLGWYEDANCSKEYDFSQPVTGNLDLYAKLNNTFSDGDLTYRLYAWEYPAGKWNDRLAVTGLSGNYQIRQSIPSSYKGYTIRRIDDWAFKGTAITSISMSSSIVEIGDNAFENCEYLLSVTGSEVRVGKNAFDGCEKLKTLDIRMKSVGSCAFYGCKSLSNISLWNWPTISGVDMIGEQAFFGCSGLTAVSIYKAKIVEADVFGYCGTNLKTIQITGSTEGWSNLWNRGCNATVEYV